MKNYLIIILIFVSVAKVWSQNPPSTSNDWEKQTNNSITIGVSSNNESSYTWSGFSNLTQGVVISLIPTEVVDIFIEQNNSIISFNTDATWPFNLLEVDIDNTGFTTLYSGSAITSHIWNSLGGLNTLGVHNLKVRFMPTYSNAQLIYREYNIKTTSASIALFKSNNNDVIRVYGNPSSTNPVPILISEGFDAHNTTPSQFIRYTGDALVNCLINADFKIYLLNYNFNSQDMRNNAAVYASAARYISSINNNQEIVAGGISMGGVIARYALAKAEGNNVPLPAYRFVSIDSPQQGAVISPQLQDFKKQNQLSLPNSAFLLHSLNNDAAKELLNYNTFDQSQSMKISFFNELNSLNGNGYPHLTKNIGVAFSNSSPNSNTGQWLRINAINNNYAFNVQSFVLTNTETQAGSYLPLSSTKIDPIVQSIHWSTNLPIIRAFNQIDVTTIRYLNPTFIPHTSALDIVGNVSKFDQVITTANTTFHDQVPSDIITPLINSLLKDNVYIQNRTYNTEVRTTVSSKKIFAGRSVNPNMTIGDVNIVNNSVIEYRAGEEIQLQPNFSSNINSDFTAIISNNIIQCNGNQIYQSKTGAFSQTENEKVQQSIFNDDSPFSIQLVNEQNTSNDLNDVLKIYPNPVLNQINFSGAINLISGYKIISIDGKSLKSADSFIENKIDVSELQNGMYLLELSKKGNEIIRLKFLKNN